MAFVHGKQTVITVATKDISPYCKTSSYEGTADFHDVTGYGKNSHVKQGGLLDGKFTAGGTYDSTTSTGPRYSIRPLLGTTVAIVRKPEGTGTGRPSEAFSGVVTKYTETNPVDDMITWSAEFEVSDDVTITTQP